MGLFFWFIWLVCTVFVAYIASTRGRSWWGWFFVSAVLSPLIAIIGLLLLPKTSFEPGPGEKKCPNCAEIIKAEARICKHCGSHAAPVEITISKEPEYEDPNILGGWGVKKKR